MTARSISSRKSLRSACRSCGRKTPERFSTTGSSMPTRRSASFAKRTGTPPPSSSMWRISGRPSALCWRSRIWRSRSSALPLPSSSKPQRLWPRGSSHPSNRCRPPVPAFSGANGHEGSKEPYEIAAIQAAPVFLDLDATIEKACDLIGVAARHGSKLIVFPEAFIPAYPLWVWFIPSGKTHPLRDLYSRLHRNSIAIPGPHAKRLAEAAGDHAVTVAIGVNERNAESSDSTLYNTLLYLGPDGRILGKHRKLIPTAGERLVWGQSPGCDLEVFDLPFARIS